MLSRCLIKSVDDVSSHQNTLDITLMQQSDENSDHAQIGQKRAGALQIGPRKKPYVHLPMLLFQLNIYPGITDHHGRHFRRTVHARAL